MESLSNYTIVSDFGSAIFDEAWSRQLIASGFMASWMLWWSLAGLIPIALHFWFQRQRREMTWAAMQFLVAAIQKQSRRIRLQQLILLLLRVAILLSLALAAAQPFLSSREPHWLGNTRPPILWVGVIDTSFSMQYRDSMRQSRWEQAIVRVREMIEQLQPGDGIILMTLGNPPRVIFSEATFDRTTALLELAKLAPTADGADLSSGLVMLDELLDNARRSHPELKSQHVVFFTDTAGDTWNAAVTSSLESSLLNLTKGAKLFIERIGDAKSDNAAVTDLQIELSRNPQDQEVTFIAEVANFSTESDIETNVQLWLDQQAVQSETITLTPRERKKVRFRQRFSEPKRYRVEMRLTPDGLTIDDRRHLLIAAVEAAKILLLEDLAGQAKYLDIALSGAFAPKDKWNATTDVQSITHWRDLDLRNVDLLVLCNTSNLPEQLPTLLRDYVQRGGKLLGFLGDRMDPANYQRLAELETNGKQTQNFFPLVLATPSPLAVYTIDARNYESPFLKVFQDFPDSGLLTTPIFRYWQLDSQQSQADSFHVDLAISQNDPLLVSYPFGNGTVAWWLTSPTPLPATIGDPEPWNAMAAWPSFLPLIREQVRHLTRSTENQTQQIVNAPLQGYLSPEITDEQVNILRPDKRVDSIRPSPPQQDGFRTWIYDGNNLPGFYELQTTLTYSNQTQAFAVNVDTRESDLTNEGAKNFQKWFSPASLEVLTSVSQPDPSESETSPSSDDSISLLNPQPLFHWFLGTLLGLLLSESLVAFWLGRSR